VTVAEAYLFPETIYGHRQRVHWIRSYLRPGDRVVEFGCGTGRLIAMPLLGWGYDVVGVDLDAASIAYGREMLARAGLDPETLVVSDLRNAPGDFDVVVASEVLEHLSDDDLRLSLSAAHDKLRPGGRLLVTVPNGYGEFELENLLWYRTGLDGLYRRLRDGRLAGSLRRAKASVAEDWTPRADPMTVADSPHLQRFTWRSIRRTLGDAGFTILEQRGAIAVCGPFTDILFSGMPRVMALNTRLGARSGRLASDFYVAAAAP
jgi:SAM-dependent methyltransferase